MEKKGILGSPLGFEVLQELHALDQIPRGSEGFDPEKNWSHIYRIWSSYGYWEKNNFDNGWLKIQREVNLSDATQDFRITQLINNFTGRKSDLGVFNLVTAKLKCHLNELATPIQWKLESQFYYEDNSLDLPEIGLIKTGKINNSILSVSTNGKMREQTIDRNVTSNWSLCESIQRLPLNDSAKLDFTYMEDLVVIKNDHHLSYQGLRSSGMSEKEDQLHYFQQLGRGVFPFEYYLDTNHECLMIVTGPRAYILDDSATDIFNKRHPWLKDEITNRIDASEVG
jgi:hypothetical protein